MNKSRHMVARQARALADRGFTVLVPDLYGTGDSAGRLEDASWQAWRTDIAYLLQWAAEQGAVHLTLWGHRMGCLLAADVAQAPPVPVSQLLFWQPVHSGKQHMAQFLRLRMAAGMSKGGAETVAALRERLQSGESLEVAGYTISGSLCGEIEAVELAQLAVPAGDCVRILEVVSEASKPVLPVTAKLVEQWSRADISCLADTAQGDPFWMTQELGFAPELIEKTTQELVKAGQIPVEATGSTQAQPGRAEPPHLPTVSSEGTRSVVFNCESQQLAGVLHSPAKAGARGVLIVVGGPQYRVGSHRQFVHLAQHLAGQGIPVFRFDYRGMGDSSGELRGFEHIDADIRCAIDAMQRASPGVSEVVIWGLCDAATAAGFYAGSDKRVKGLVLANPWVYSEQGEAKAYLKHYYLQRLLQKDFWAKVFSGKFSVLSSVSSGWALLRNAFGGLGGAGSATSAPETGANVDAISSTVQVANSEKPQDLVARLGESLAMFTGDIFFIISGNDLAAAQFVDATRSNSRLSKLMRRSNVRQVTLPNADHTFSSANWRDEVGDLTEGMIKSRLLG